MASRRRKSSRKGKKPSKRVGFEYRPRSASNFKKRAKQSGSTRDKCFETDLSFFTPKDGNNLVRILPPTFDDAEHYGLDVYIHYDVGADSGQYLCPKKMSNEPCPICEEREKAIQAGDEEYANSLKPTKRVLVYMIDRDDEKEGLQLWSMAWTLDRDISALAIDKRTGEVFEVDNPDEGYDIEFDREGTGMKTKYVGLKLAREATALDNDDALEHAVENPLDSILVLHDYDYIKDVFEGAGAPPPDDDDDDDDLEDDEPDEDEDLDDEDGDEDEEPDEDELPEWSDVQKMDIEDLDELVEDHELDIDPDDFDEDDEGLDEYRDAVCKDLGLKKPKKKGKRGRKEKKPASSAKKKAKALRKRRGK